MKYSELSHCVFYLFLVRNFLLFMDSFIYWGYHITRASQFFPTCEITHLVKNSFLKNIMRTIYFVTPKQICSIQMYGRTYVRNVLIQKERKHLVEFHKYYIHKALPISFLFNCF